MGLIVRLVAFQRAIVATHGGMALRNGTRRHWRVERPQMLNEIAEVLDIGRANRAPGRLCENAQGNRQLKDGGESGPPSRNARCARRFGALTRSHPP